MNETTAQIPVSELIPMLTAIAERNGRPSGKIKQLVLTSHLNFDVANVDPKRPTKRFSTPAAQ